MWVKITLVGCSVSSTVTFALILHLHYTTSYTLYPRYYLITTSKVFIKNLCEQLGVSYMTRARSHLSLRFLITWAILLCLFLYIYYKINLSEDNPSKSLLSFWSTYYTLLQQLDLLTHSYLILFILHHQASSSIDNAFNSTLSRYFTHHSLP